MRLVSFLTLSFCYCVATNHAKDECIENFDGTGSDTTKKLRFDGLYNCYDSSIARKNSTPIIANFLVFFKYGKVFYDSHTYGLKLPDFQCEFYSYHAPKRFGNYKIIGDSIYAKISTQFYYSGMQTKYLDAHYIGYIKNADTISGWKMIPPYPKIKLELNIEFARDTTAKTLYFVKYERVQELERYVGD